ncbi:MAG: hypothetical protein WBQ46_08430, partial [Terriglobales bacterium]
KTCLFSPQSPSRVNVKACSRSSFGVTPFPAHPGRAAKGKVPCSRPLSVEVKYIDMDVHKEAIAIAVMNEAGKV